MLDPLVQQVNNYQPHAVVPGYLNLHEAGGGDTRGQS